MRGILSLILVLFSATMATSTLGAADETITITRQTALERLLKSEAIEATWFTDSFLKAVPLPQMITILGGMRSSMGKYVEVRPDGPNFLSVFEKGSYPTQIALDKEGRIAGLLFSPPRAQRKSIDEVVASLKELPGKVSVLVREGDVTKVELNPNEPLAVGSAFKLEVLRTLQKRIAAGKLAWNTVVPLEAAAKSLPTGDLREWPEGSQLTVETLATLMISRSDNTATDQLMRVLGVDAIEQGVHSRNRPFLTTAELFKIKCSPGLSQRYVSAADEKTRRAVVAEAASLPLPAVETVPNEPTALEAEWYYTAPELAALILEAKDLPLMSVNPGLAGKGDWRQIAYKGGSEAGVVCLVTWALAKDGREITAVATWNNPAAPLDTNHFFALYTDLLDQLRQPK